MSSVRAKFLCFSLTVPILKGSIMQIKHIALAAMAVVAASQAQAFTNVTGASASSVGYVESLNSICNNGTAAAPTVAVYVRRSTVTLPNGTTAVNTGALGNSFTVACPVNFAGTADNEVRFDVAGGSLNAILKAATTPTTETGVANGTFLPSQAGNTNCTATAGTGPLAFLGTRLNICATSVATASGKSVGGFMDVEPAIFKAQNVIKGTYAATPATFSQAFALGVSKELYEALQAAQGLTVGAVNAANQPSIGKAQVVSIINNVDFNDAKNLGASFLVPGTAKTNLTYCRRPNTSGTQMSAELYFLNNPTASGKLAGADSSHEPQVFDSVTAANNTVVVDNGTGNTLTVIANNGTGDVKNCLNHTAPAATTANPNPAPVTPAGDFAIGILSAENNPVATNSLDTYRLVKINGASTTDGAANDQQTANATKGLYDFVFESVVFNPSNNAVLKAINSGVKTTNTPGLFLNTNSATPESNFGRNGSSTNNYQSN